MQTRLVALVAIAVLETVAFAYFALAPTEARAEWGKKENICGSWNNYCKGGSSGGGGGRGGGGGYNNGPSRQQIEEQNRRAEEQRRRAAGLTANEAGGALYEQGRYAEAINEFEKALLYLPNDQVIKQNLRNAQEQLRLAEAGAREQRERARRQQEERRRQQAEAERLRREREEQEAFNRAKEELTSALKTGSTGLALGNSEASAASGLRLKSSTPTLGLPTNTAQAELKLKGLPGSPSVSGRGTSDGNTQGTSAAGAQLKSAAQHGKLAESMSDYGAKEESGRVFDTIGDYAGSLDAVDVRGMSRGIEIPPELKDDPVVQKHVADISRNEAQYASIEKELETVRAKMDTATPSEKSTLAVEEAKLKQERSNIEQKQALSEYKLKQHISLTVGADWKEKAAVRSENKEPASGTQTQ